MLLQRLRHGLLLDIVSAILLALALLAGITQARSSTEKAAHAGFAGAFELCLQSGKAGDSPVAPDHDCDECRLPGLIAGLTPATVSALAERTAEPAQRILSGPALAGRPSYYPEARGPPAKA